MFMKLKGIRMKIAVRLSVFVFLIALCTLPLHAGGLQITSINVHANQNVHNGHCPAVILYSATVNVFAPENGDIFNYQWTRSDNATTQTQIVRLHKGINHVPLSETWTLGAPGQHYSIWEEIHVNSGNIHDVKRSQVTQVNCQ